MKATAFLTFQGDAKAALTFWREAFPTLKALKTQEHPDCSQACQVAAARIGLAGIHGEGDQTMVPLANFGFSALFTWFAKRYGVSWPLNLP
jgi:predicted 3-demethylubiquinone-9 3-methyltransferase (glyoxalase superfamily)